MKLNEHKNSKKQGDAGLGIAIGWFSTNGYTVCVPLTDSQPYDLIVDSGTLLVRVQVKTCTYKGPNGNYRVDLRVSGGNRSGIGKVKLFDNRECDSLFVVTAEHKYLIPVTAFSARSELTLCKKYDKFQA